MTARLQLRVSAYRAEARDVVSMELRDPHGRPLPAFTPGSHLEICLPSASECEGELIRHYSICNSSGETDRYVVAVGRAEKSRGGSRTIHDMVRVGMLLSVSAPRNSFELVPHADHYRFIAGGIGITPILCMIRWCEAHGKRWSLLYCARARVRAAFYEELSIYGPRARFHFDDEAGGGMANIDAELAAHRAGEHVYCCGPGSLMSAVDRITTGWPAGKVHFEWFAGRPPGDISLGNREAFQILLRRSGRRIEVAAGQSILEALEEQGLCVPSSCREGICRTCETTLCAGEADHRDYVLSDAERAAQQSILICVSRARTAVLELDL